MEFFLPGIAALLIGALIVFLLLPRLGAPVLVGLSVVLLVFCLYNHYKLFGSEYKLSTWQDGLKWYAPLLMYGGLTVAVLLYLGYLFSSKGASILPASNVSDQPTNIVESVTNTAKVANDAVNQVASQVSNVLGFGNVKANNKANNGILANLGNILNTPAKRNNQAFM